VYRNRELPSSLENPAYDLEVQETNTKQRNVIQDRSLAELEQKLGRGHQRKCL
jgi:hypothetical protein